MVARFLDVLFSRGPALKKTNIQMLLGLNYTRFLEYLDWMLKHELVAETVDDEKAERIVLTPKGIESYQTIVVWIKGTLEGVKI